MSLRAHNCMKACGAAWTPDKAHLSRAGEGTGASTCGMQIQRAGTHLGGGGGALANLMPPGGGGWAPESGGGGGPVRKGRNLRNGMEGT